MRVLVIGAGGREHALCWKIARSPLCEAIYCAPGNAGIAEHAELLALDATDHSAVIAACREHRIDLVVIGPEQPLVDGLADALRGASISSFGPDAAPARLEGSKSFAKDFMERHGIPTAEHRSFDDPAVLQAHLAQCDTPVVVKADGLAAGKGVFVCMSRGEAIRAGEILGSRDRFGAAASRVVVEQFMDGEEATVLALVDGATVLPLLPSQDHKRRFDGDLGPNTGGMGAYTPVPAMDEALLQQVIDTVLVPAAEGMVADGTPYRGLLYAGLMLMADGPRVVEFNCRFGDPEAQPVLLALQSDLLPLLKATADGELNSVEPPRWYPGAVCCVVMVSGGYPGSYEKGLPIEGLGGDDGEDLVVFHAGTRRGDDGQVLASGGRVLGVTARGPDFRTARNAAYARIETIHWQDRDYRRDIGWRALLRSEED